MVGRFEFPVTTPSTRFLREQDKANKPKSFLETLEAPTAPSVSAPSAGGMLAPGIPAPSQEPSRPTYSFREVLTGRTGTRAEAPRPGWGAYLRKEDWQQDRGISWDPRSALEVLDYPGIRHAINFGNALSESSLDMFRESFTLPWNLRPQ